MPRKRSPIRRRSQAVQKVFTRALENSTEPAADRLEPMMPRRPPLTTFTLLDPLDAELLLTLAWVAPCTTGQLQRLVFPQPTLSPLQRHLRRLADEEFISGALYYQQQAGKKPTRVGHVWSLRPRGLEAVVHDDRAPAHPAKLRQALVRHDLLVSELVSWLVPAAQAHLSGIRIMREQRVYPG